MSPRASLLRTALAGRRRENPHIAAGKRAHNDRYMDLARARYAWMLASFILTCAVAIQAGSLAWLAAQSRVVPYVSVIDRNYKVIGVGPASRVDEDSAVLQGVTQATVVDFIRNARSITADPIAQVAIMESVWEYAAPDTRQMLSDYYAESPPGVAAQEGRRVSVEIESVLLRSDRLWEVRWTEVEWDPSGHPIQRERWEARLSVDRTPPSDAEQALTNPLGIHIAGLSWSKLIR